MKVLRSSFVAAVAIFAAACGDKVNIVQPDTTAQNAVTGVAVAPLSATMSIGQTVPFTAAVTATGTATTTVTWSSSDASKVSVSAAGVATAVAATPGVAICATSTFNTNAKGCASVVVSVGSNPISSSVSIASITTGGNLNTPVNPLNTAGQIDVRINVVQGTSKLDSIVLFVGNKRADGQQFSAAQSAALRYASDKAIETQTVLPQILFNVNTAAFTNNTTTGANTATFPNGAQSISVRLFAGGATAAAATAQTSLTFNNIDTYTATITSTGTTANALSASGFRYDRGGLNITVSPISYSGAAVNAGTVTFGSAACDGSGTGARAKPLVAPVAPSANWTATFAATGAAATNVTNYEFTANCNAGATNAIGETIAVTATNANGDALFAAAAPANANAAFGTVAAAVSLRLDNRGPTVPTLVQNPNVRQNGWVNASIGLTTLNAVATPDGMVVAGANRVLGDPSSANCVALAAVDCGVSGTANYVRVATSAAGLVDEALAATASKTPTLPAPSLTGGTYCGVWSVQDALGNESLLPAAATPCTATTAVSDFALAAQSALFGVDIAPPTIAFSAGLANMSATTAAGRISTATMAAEFQVTVTDTGSIGNSGMQSASAVVGTVNIRTPAPNGTTCLVGAASLTLGAAPYAATCAGSTSVNAAPAFPLVPTTTVAASATVGYFFYSAVSQDAAGNRSGAVTRVTAHDPAANVPSLTTALYATPITGGSVTFNANASDNLDIRDIRYTLGYAGGLAGPLAYPTQTIAAVPSASAGAAGVTSFSNNNIPVPVTIANFVRQVENVTGNAPVTVGGAFKPNALNGFLRDVVNAVPAGSPIITAIPAGSVTTGVSYLTLAAPLLPDSWAITNAATTVCGAFAAAPVAQTCAAGAGTSLSVTLNADLFGPTATFNSPYARVDFYALIGGNLEQIGTTTTYTTVDNGATMGRRHRYSLAWTPGLTSPVTGTTWVAGAQSLYAVGVNAAGDALVTPVNGVIAHSIVNP